jgi:hypothetical protein
MGYIEPLNIVNYQNPVSSTTVFDFNLISEGNAKFALFDLMGNFFLKLLLFTLVLVVKS